MSTALQSSNPLMIWDDQKKLEEIRQIFAPKLTTQEFDAFVGMGKAAGLNPFLREIWAVKYQDSAPAQIFVGRDGYRKAAQRHAEYDYHECDAVYSNDRFSRNSISGEIIHEYNLKDRGSLLGAYCIVKRRTSSRATYTWVKLSEYSTGKSLWNSDSGKPETMIKKVAESQGLRGAFQDLLGGTYGEEEMSEKGERFSDNKQNKSELLMNRIISAKTIANDPNIQDAEVIDVIETDDREETGEAAHPHQIKEIYQLIDAKDFNMDRLAKALKYYKAETLGGLTVKQAYHFIDKLRKEPNKAS